MAVRRTYLILEGVRRAKAWEQNGATMIRAELIYADGTSGPGLDVAIEDLLSPKSEIDLTDSQKANRYWRLWSLIRNGQGDVLPWICVTPGNRGTPLKDVVLRS